MSAVFMYVVANQMLLYPVMIFSAIWSVCLSFKIESVASSCARLIQPPDSSGDRLSFEKTLEINCYRYYNVVSSAAVRADLFSKYEDVIELSRLYDSAYSSNEHVQYMSKSWLSMIAADPLSSIQRQAKECNSHLLKTFIGYEDVLRSGPLFKSELKFLSECLDESLSFSSEQRANILSEFDVRISNVTDSMKSVGDLSALLSASRKDLMDLREIFRHDIIANFNEINSVGS